MSNNTVVIFLSQKLYVKLWDSRWITRKLYVFDNTSPTSNDTLQEVQKMALLGLKRHSSLVG